MAASGVRINVPNGVLTKFLNSFRVDLMLFDMVVPFFSPHFMEAVFSGWF